MAACRLLLLGPPLLEREGQVEPIRLHKGLALAAYLAIERRAFSREHLATLLWPALGPHNALAALRRTLTYLRETVGGRCIRTSGDLVQFDPARIDVDIIEFQSLLRADASGTELANLERAAGLYRGAFLEGFVLGDCPEFDDWQDGVRRRMEEQLDRLLETLCREYLRAEKPSSALPFAERWLELDRLNECAHRMLMEIHARMGRVDQARKQFESCIRMLSREGIEPERETRDLHDVIIRHRLGPARTVPAVPASRTGDAPLTEQGGPQDAGARGESRTIVRRRWPWIAALAGSIVAAISIVMYLARGFIFVYDLSVVAVEPDLRNNELAGLQFVLRNEGIGLRSVRYAVAISSNRAVVAQRDYVVYADKVPMPRNSESILQIDRSDVEAYINTHNVRIPPGDYSLTVSVNPEKRILAVSEESFDNNRLGNSSLFFYPGTAPEAAFAVDIAYHGPGILDVDHPLTVYIGQSGTSALREEQWWARFVVSREGTYFFPVEDVPKRDTDASGYVMFVIHDVRPDPLRQSFPGSGDASAIYREDTTNLSYGVFNSASGTSIYPGRRYRIDFSPPAPPARDTYEVDDHKEIPTIIDYATLPIRQRHTFHDEGTGDIDEDWFRIDLKAGETVTVETYLAGPWGCDTAIDIADARRYVMTGNDKSELDFFSRLTYKNETGTEQAYYFLVKPYSKYDTGVNRFADYVVEFRR